jgi:hypothetical protein
LNKIYFTISENALAYFTCSAPKGATQGLIPPVPIAIRKRPMNETALDNKSNT